MERTDQDAPVEGLPPSFREAPPIPEPTPGSTYVTGLTGRRYVRGVPGGVPIEPHLIGVVRQRKPQHKGVRRRWESDERKGHWLRAYADCGNSKRACEVANVLPATVAGWNRNVPWFKERVEEIKAEYEKLYDGRPHDMLGQAFELLEHAMTRGKANDKILKEGVRVALEVAHSQGYLRPQVSEPERNLGAAPRVREIHVYVQEKSQMALPEVVEGQVTEVEDSTLALVGESPFEEEDVGDIEIGEAEA